ncbi:hypothetical protein KEJ50_04820 [Candidatus Bathyarchaeota archaeon]|nr:hypothetical protein [Candidatus Bathyarchaeota archaeon]
MELSKISKKGLTNIPAKIRKAVKIEKGDFLAWELNEEPESIKIKVIKNPYKFLKGRINDPNLTYEKVEELSDKILFEVIKKNANNRS